VVFHFLELQAGKLRKTPAEMLTFPPSFDNITERDK
jgi:hypothetical protein